MITTVVCAVVGLLLLAAGICYMARRGLCPQCARWQREATDPDTRRPAAARSRRGTCVSCGRIWLGRNKEADG